MRAKITNTETGAVYIVESAKDCVDDTDRSAYKAFRGDAIAMGKIVVEPDPFRYAVVVPERHSDGSESWPALYSFMAGSDEEAIAAFNTEMNKYCQHNHRNSRLLSGGVFWSNALLTKDGEVIYPEAVRRLAEIRRGA